VGSPELDEVIRVAGFRAALRQFLSQSERVAARYGITSQRYLLLLMIKGAPDGSQRSTVTELTTRLHLAQHTVTELVKRACRAQLVRRAPSKTDRRVVYLTLSEKGERVFAQSFEALQDDRRKLSELVEWLTTDSPAATNGHSSE
jgi:DNA-binding MarR family transcriptional regulator